MKAKIFLAEIAALLVAGGLALAQSGAISTSPVVVSGAFSYIGGPQASVVRASGGTFTANGSTQVNVVNANVTANSVIVFGMKTSGGTVNGGPFVFTITPGTGFSIKSGSTDTSVYNYFIMG